MSAQGIILIDLFAIGLIAAILNLVRTKRLYVAYAAIWLLATLVMMAIISIPPLLAVVTRSVGATFPASAMSLLAFAFIFLVLLFFSVQLSILSARQIELAQALALQQAQTPAPAGNDAPSA